MRAALRLLGRWFAVAALCSAVGAAGAASALPVQDDRGRAIDSALAPQRIVSLLPSLTESVCVLGACDKLVGVDRYSNWPSSVQAVRKVGGGLDPHLETIVALKPDVVLLSHSSRLAQRLESLGLRTVVLEPRTLADVQRVLHVLGAVLHIPPEQGAQRVWQEMLQGVAQAVQAMPAGIAGGTVYLEVNRGPYAAGPASFMGELLARMGMRNIVPAEMGPFPKLNPEFVIRAQPDVILLTNPSMEGSGTYPGWQTLRAVRAQRVCAFDAAAADVLVRPGPRMAEAARLMVQCLADKAPRRGGGA